MRRSPILLVVLTLAIVTAVAFLRLADLLAAEPPSGEVAPGDGDAALVRGFYDAVNATLETGQSTEFDRLLAADFVVHGGPAGRPPTEAGFVRHLASLHAVYPAMRLLPQDLTAQGDVVVVRVRVEGATTGAFLNLPLAGQPAPWAAIDIFRIARGTIAEYWGGHDQAAVLESLRSASLDVPDSALQTVSLVRTTVAPGGSLEVRSASGPEAIVLESGRLTVAVAPKAIGPARVWRSPPVGSTGPPEEVASDGAATLASGDLVLFPEGLRATVRNDGDAAGTVLTIALRRPGGSARALPPSASPTGTPVLATDDLAGGALVALPGGPATLGLGRATLAPGTALPVAAPGVALFVVESGSLGLAGTDGAVWSRRAADNSTTTSTDGILGPGDAVTIGPGANSDLRNVGTTPLVLLMVTITPVG